MPLPDGNPMPMRVLIVDSHLSVAEMITESLGREGRFEPVGEAATGVEGLSLFRKYQPTLVITSLELGQLSGPEMIREMRTENPEVRALVHTGCQKRDLLYFALETEPQGFVHKTEGLRIYHQALSVVAQGGSYRSLFATDLLTQKRRDEKVSGRLTTQERALVRLVAGGMSTKQIASQLCLSPKTVENYRKQIMSKLGLNGIAALTLYAERRGMLE